MFWPYLIMQTFHIHPVLFTVTEIQKKLVVKHNTWMPYSNVLHVSVHQNLHQAPLLQKFTSISRIINKYKSLKHKLIRLNSNMKRFYTQKETELVLGYKHGLYLLF